MLVAVGGFFTCGNQCDEVIINRDNRPGNSDIMMDFSKLGLLVCLIVGIIIRNQSNKAGIFGIIEQLKKVDNCDPVHSSLGKASYIKVSASSSNDLNDSTIDNLSTDPALPLPSTPTGPPPPPNFCTTAAIQFINSLVPALTAILVKDDLINYVETGSGFLAPVFMIVYPCSPILTRHDIDRPASSRHDANG